MLERATRANTLYDFYGNLLSEKQKQLFELYYQEDLSLAEIAENFDMSRQGVSDNIRRCEILLESYEDQLQLYQKHNAINSKLKIIINLIISSDMSDVEKATILNVVEDIRRTN